MKAELRRAAALLALFCAVASVFLAGQSYFFCPWMQRASASCCCAPERPSGDSAAISRAPCCRRTTLEAAPSVRTDFARQAASVPPASAFAGELVLVPDGAAARARSRSVDAKERGARAGPSVELFELHSAYLI